MSLKERFQKVISDSGLSLPDFAEKVGVARNTLVRYRDGERSPSIEFLERICEVFNVDRSWLLLGESCTPGKASIDMDILTPVIAGVEKGLAGKNLVLAPDKKAQLIALLYDYYAKGEDEAVEEETVERYLKLAI